MPAVYGKEGLYWVNGISHLAGIAMIQTCLESLLPIKCPIDILSRSLPHPVVLERKTIGHNLNRNHNSTLQNHNDQNTLHMLKFVTSILNSWDSGKGNSLTACKIFLCYICYCSMNQLLESPLQTLWLTLTLCICFRLCPVSNTCLRKFSWQTGNPSCSLPVSCHLIQRSKKGDFAGGS